MVYQPDASGDALTEAVRTTGASVLVVRSTQVTEPMLDAGALALVVRAGAGVNTIDLAGASRRGIYVSNCPGKNAVAVAELTMGLLLALDRRIPDNVADLRAGTWNKKEYSKARGLLGRSIGLLGFGSIGQEVARRARAFGMPVLVWSRRFATDDEARRVAAETHGVEVVASAAELVSRVDVISVHLALGKDTRGFVNAELLSHARPGAFFINTARGEVVDAAALEAAVRDKGLRVGLDVFAAEPSAATGAFSDPLVSLPNVYGTHHIGASTDQAQDAIAARNRPHRPDLQGDRPGAERGEPGPADAGHPHAGGAPSRSPGRAGARVRPAARRAPERAGDREHHLRGGARGRGPHQPGRPAARGHAAGHPRRPRGHPGPAGRGGKIGSIMSTTAARIFNFSAGPAVLPVPVLEEAQRDLVTLPGVGMSVLEISHRSKAFEAILAKTEADVRALGKVPANYKVLFLQGGASLQFSMVPMNLLGPGQAADYIVTGGWAQKAVKEAKRVGTVNIAGSTESENFSRIPRQDELTLDPNAAYVHMTTNNTLFGTEWKDEPEVGNVPLVADTSSDMFSRPIDVSKYGLIYAGAQKNLGPSGVTLVIIREDLLARSSKSLHTMLNYAVHAENGSMYNTPPCFGIYLMGLVMKWALAEGGLEAIGARNARKAGEALRRDRSHRLLQGHAPTRRAART